MTDHLPKILSRDQHDFSRKFVDDAALKTLYRLDKAGYEAYLVGGCVRDILLGKKPKDFDVVTNAFPQQVRRLFGNSRIIGRRFKLVHVIFSGEVVEVSTFRGNLSQEEEREVETDLPTMITNDNVYGTLEEDVWRRDFTVNALYYNIANFSVVDYVDGLNDLENHILRVIGEPERRFREDPLRMLRAIRLAAKLNFSIEKEAENSMRSLYELIHHVPTARVFDEFMKLFFTGHALSSYERLHQYDFFNLLFPAWREVALDAEYPLYQKLILQAMRNTDQRFNSGMTLNPGFLLAVIGWPIVQIESNRWFQEKKKMSEALHRGMEVALKKLSECLAIPKRFTEMMRTIWMMQYHLIQRRKQRVHQNLGNRYFRAALDFLELRTEVGEDFAEVTQWWREFAKQKGVAPTAPP